MKKILSAAVLLAAAALSASAMAGDRLDAVQKSGVLRVGTPADYRPFAMDENGAIVGHDIDVIEAMAAAAGWKVEYVKTPWKGIEAGVKENRFDVAVGGITQTLARTSWGAFLPGYAPFGKVALVRKSELGKYRTLEDLNQPSVRVIKNPGGTNEQFVLAREELRDPGPHRRGQGRRHDHRDRRGEALREEGRAPCGRVPRAPPHARQ